MGYEVKILADSVSPDGVRLTTMQTVYPRFIHSEMLRHRMFSHSVASSRAIPVEKLIQQLKNDPFVPETFNKRVKGMGVGKALSDEDQQRSRQAWLWARDQAIKAAETLIFLDVDKSRANRLLEPFVWVTDIITATEWENFFALRDHSAAQPEFQVLARMMREAMEASVPRELRYGEWHLPLIKPEEWDLLYAELLHNDARQTQEAWDVWKRVSAGRCARVSFDKQDEREEIEQSLDRAFRLVKSGHLSPFEHVARPLQADDHELVAKNLSPFRAQPDFEFSLANTIVATDEAFVGNLRGYVQMRKEFPYDDRFDLLVKEAEASV